MNAYKGRLFGLVCGTLLALAAGRHPAWTQELQYPVATAVAEDGTLFIADREFHGIWKFADGKLEKYFEGSPKFRTPLNAVRCLAWDHQGKLLAGDSATREVYRFDDAGQPVPLTKGQIGTPTAIAVRKSGEILVADQELMYVWRVPAEGGDPVKLAEVAGIVGLCLDQDDQLWVTTRLKHPLRRVTPDGKVEEVLAERPFPYPQHIVLDEHKTAYIADNYAQTIWKVPAGGAPETLVAGAPLVGPVGITRAGGNLYVTDPKARAVFQIDAGGQLTRLVGGK
ncbi:MAG: hypothetical protein GXY58_09970 [Planctomycetaceae bacterium]|nr:hypothetical protein [Planctomycetaceae bacterium]